MKLRRVSLDLDGLYLLVDEADTRAELTALYHQLPQVADADAVRFVHVMSEHARGEVRGYAIWNGRLWLRGPCYTGEWPEVDRAVTVAMDLFVEPYAVEGGGGRVTYVGPGSTGRAS